MLTPPKVFHNDVKQNLTLSYLVNQNEIVEWYGELSFHIF